MLKTSVACSEFCLLCRNRSRKFIIGLDEEIPLLGHDKIL